MKTEIVLTKFRTIIDEHSDNFDDFSDEIWQKVAKIGKNTEGVNKPTETDLKKNSGENWQKVVKIGKNTEGVIGNHFDVYHDYKK